MDLVQDIFYETQKGFNLNLWMILIEQNPYEENIFIYTKCLNIKDDEKMILKF